MITDFVNCGRWLPNLHRQCDADSQAKCCCWKVNNELKKFHKCVFAISVNLKTSICYEELPKAVRKPIHPVKCFTCLPTQQFFNNNVNNIFEYSVYIFL